MMPVTRTRLLLGAALLASLTGLAKAHAPVATQIDTSSLAGYGTSVATSDTVQVVGAPDARAVAVRDIVYRQSDASTVTVDYAEVRSSDSVSGDRFGQAVATDGDLLVVGAPGPAGTPGAAYVFARAGRGTPWLQQARLASSVSSDSGFGSHVAVSGDTIVVGAPFLADSRGGAFVFERSLNGASYSYAETARLLAQPLGVGDRFGSSVAIDEDTLIIGADGDDDAANAAGAVFVYRRTSTGGWSRTQKLLSGQGAHEDLFGISVDIDGNTLVVGSQKFTANTGSSVRVPSRAYVFSRDVGGTWTRSDVLSASDGNADGQIRFGWSVSIADDNLLIGWPQARKTYLFKPDDTPGEWVEVHRATAQDEWFGASVSVSKHRAIIGGKSPATPGSSVAVSAWQLRPQLHAPGEHRVLEGTRPRFAWAINSGRLDALRLGIGAAPGASDQYDSGVLERVDFELPTGLTADPLPGDEARFARFSYRFAGSGVWHHTDYAFPARDVSVVPRFSLTLNPDRQERVSPSPWFAWTPDEAASWYQLWVSDSVGGVHTRWVRSDAANCMGAPCQALIATGLQPGAATWWIRPWNSTGTGPWGQARPFVISADAPDAVSTGRTPESQRVGPRAKFAWDAMPTSTWYQLWVNDGSGTTTVNRWFDAEQLGCAVEARCLTDRLTVPDAGSWWVRSWNVNGSGPWSSARSFM